MDTKDQKSDEKPSAEISGEETATIVDATPAPVSFVTYLHFASLQRKEERDTPLPPPRGLTRWLRNLLGRNNRAIPLSEKETASRALRLASWSSAFYLITTDILGPFNAPFAISQVGWVPGIILYYIMGIVALYTGLLLWHLFVRLDSLRYPIRSYADIVERILGMGARRVSTVLQSVQLIVVVGIICLANAQALVQIAEHHICFSVAIVIWALLGMVLGQIRTLKNYASLSNMAIWLNLLLIFSSMGFVAHSPPNFAAALSSLGVPAGPVKTQLFASVPLFSQVVSVASYAYGGCMIFPEIMAEMRRPMDFWKGMIAAQALIFSAYVLYGAFVYSQQGQFVLPLAYQGVSRYALQTSNVISLISGIIAAGLYGNIGIKVVYHNVIEDWFHGPPVMSSKGRYIWSTFIVGSAIPQVQTINGLIGAVAIMQFTYTFPPLLHFGFDVINDAMVADYDPINGQYRPADTWKQGSRWKRGLCSGRWYFKLFNLVLFLASMSMAGLGMWAAGESAKATFAMSGAATSFGCRAPV
ncbi:aa-trans domain-containing protein [Favolaschia claudopus]|uniref:Aa-trans domain-containing protein n=1 Tax=Favolaschia claudopus TaxID=2862362 RepID=A0AAV9ZTD6_9AGAR